MPRSPRCPRLESNRRRTPRARARRRRPRWSRKHACARMVGIDRMPTNAELVRSVWEPMDGVNIAAVDWGADVLRQLLGSSYSPDVELTTLQSGFGSGMGEFY